MKHPEYARRIQKLRAALQLTQHALAERLHVRPQVVASWEQGRRVPSAGSYRRLAGLAPPREAWFFLEQIGVTKRLVQAKWPGRASRRSPHDSPATPRTTRVRIAKVHHMPFVQIPLLRQDRPATPREITEDDIESVIAIPADVLPDKPDAYVGIRQRGPSMAPILRDRFLVVVDRTDREPLRLAGKMVAAWGEQGLRLRWLETDRSSGKLVLRPENPGYPAVPVDAAASDCILGKVVFWWGTPG